MVREIASQGTSAVLSTEGENRASESRTTPRTDFAAFLAEAQAKDVRFSNHALKRMEQRQIDLKEGDISLLAQGMERAERKGSKESLFLMDETAFVVNVNSRTVVTAVEKEAMKDKTFTNIDSAILLLRGA